MRQRRYLTFDMDNPRHREAFAIFDAQPNKLKSEFVIGCILESAQADHLEAVIRQSVSDSLAEIRFAERKPLPARETAPTEDIADLPTDLLFAMDDGF